MANFPSPRPRLEACRGSRSLRQLLGRTRFCGWMCDVGVAGFEDDQRMTVRLAICGGRCRCVSSTAVRQPPMQVGSNAELTRSRPTYDNFEFTHWQPRARGCGETECRYRCAYLVFASRCTSATHPESTATRVAGQHSLVRRKNLSNTLSIQKTFRRLFFHISTHFQSHQ